MSEYGVDMLAHFNFMSKLPPFSPPCLPCPRKISPIYRVKHRVKKAKFITSQRTCRSQLHTVRLSRDASTPEQVYLVSWRCSIFPLFFLPPVKELNGCVQHARGVSGAPPRHLPYARIGVRRVRESIGEHLLKGAREIRRETQGRGRSWGGGI